MTKAQLEAAKAAIKVREQESKVVENYKEILEMFKAAGIAWSQASKDTLKIVHPDIVKASREDYKILNTLRDWYTEEEL